MAVLLVAVALGAAGFAAFHYVELYREEVPVAPSAQAQANDFLALERWLEQQDVKVRNVYHADLDFLMSSPEKTVLVPASMFSISPVDYTRLDAWIASGTDLIVFIDNPCLARPEQKLGLYLSTAGIWVDQTGEDPETEESAPPAADGADVDEAVVFRSFNAAAELLPGPSGNAGLIRVRMGKGSLCCTGIPLFMYSEYIGSPPNAVLAWHLTGGSNQSSRGLVFVLPPEGSSGLFGNLAAHGNWLPLLVSVALALATAVWASLAPFGLQKDADERAGRSIADRFSAEAWFLVRYRSLGAYLADYREIIRTRLRIRTGREFSDDELVDYLVSTAGTERVNTERLVKAGPHISLERFAQLSATIEHILETL